MQSECQNHKKLTLVLIDFNHLKETTDKYGHIMGDKMIKDGAKCLVDSFSPDGKVFRLGGDEFAIVLWDKTEKINFYYDILNQTLKKYNNTNNIKISLAKGHTHCECNANKNFFEEAYKIADQNMYIDKEKYHKLMAKAQQNIKNL